MQMYLDALEAGVPGALPEQLGVQAFSAGLLFATAAKAAGAPMRSAVRLTVRGTSTATATPPHTSHARTDATICTGVLASRSPWANAGPAVSGRTNQAIRTASNTDRDCGSPANVGAIPGL